MLQLLGNSLLVLLTLVQQSGLPRFEDHAVQLRFRGKPALVNLRSDPGAPMYRTVLRKGAAKGPNFADHFTIVTWGCGSNCQRFAIVDARSGRVKMISQYASNGLLFRRSSALLIADPIRESDMQQYDNALPEWLVTRYFLWDGKSLVQIDSSRSATPADALR